MKSLCFLSALLAMLLTGCCTRKACDENARIYIAFYGFDPADVDTIYTTGYVKGSSFTQKATSTQADTALPPSQPNADELVLIRRSEYYIPLGSGGVGGAQRIIQGSLPDDYEWQVYIPAVNRTLLIDRYGYKSFKCNRCFPAGPADNKKHTLISCVVNGISRNANDIRIYK